MFFFDLILQITLTCGPAIPSMASVYFFVTPFFFADDVLYGHFVVPCRFLLIAAVFCCKILVISNRSLMDQRFYSAAS